MTLLFLSLLGGILTILSPCVLPVLPVIIGGAVTNHQRWRPLVITASLVCSIVLFTLLLKWSTAFLDVPPRVWSSLSGGLVFGLGMVTLFPTLWERVAAALRLSDRSHQLLSRSATRRNVLGAMLVGFSLGPVFSSCSPTYALILATVLPQSFAVGVVNLIAYAIGLASVLLLIAVFGQRLITRLKWATNPRGWFKRLLGILFIVVGILIITRADKKIEIALIERGFGITKLESRLVNNVFDKTDEKQSEEKKVDTNKLKMNVVFPRAAPEIQGISSWINSDPLTLEQLRGKVVVVDFWTYSCINCIRTLPFLNAWYEKYADDGLVILGVHSPEFAFEKVHSNVEAAVVEYGIHYPVALDNDFATWRAYSNRYWPAKYFIDRQGRVRHTHFGEGEYEESEEVIRALLAESGEQLEDEVSVQDATTPPISRGQTPETYFGYARAERFANVKQRVQDNDAKFTLASSLDLHEWTLGGIWRIEDEKIIAKSSDAKLRLRFVGKSVYVVAGSEKPAAMSVLLNGQAIALEDGGNDVVNGIIAINGSRLYHLIELFEVRSGDTLELVVDPDVQLHAFTFGS